MHGGLPDDVETIAIVGAGQMGAAIGARLVAHGCRVPTLLAGRTAETRNRALAAGMVDAEAATIAAAPLILSIVPPAAAGDVIDALAPALRSVAGKPVLIDCNPLAPTSKQDLASRVVALGCTFVHAAIIGATPTPTPDECGPRLYVSGPGANRVAALERFGLDVRLLPGPAHAAEAIKMCYAALNKGLTALTTIALLAAGRAGVGEALINEIGVSQPWLLERARRSVPAAYRWEAEMDEIAAFLADDPPAAAVYQHVARLFADRAAAQADGSECRVVRRMLQMPD